MKHKLVKWTIRITAAVVLLSVGVIAGATLVDSPTITAKPSPPSKSQLLTLVNAERTKNGMPPLKDDLRLDASAQMKANDETEFNYFGHVSKNDGKQGYEYINSVGISCVTDSENLTQNTIVNDSQHAFDAWLRSPAHHSAMIDAKYSLTGFGISGDQIVEHFCQTQ